MCLALRVSQGLGHTRMALAPAEGSAADLVLRAAGLGPFDLEAFLETVPAIAGRPGAATPLIMQEGWLYSQRMLDFEEDLAARVKALCAREDLEHVPVPEDIFRSPSPLNPRQRAAVEMAMRGALTLVTGGPGTGKTTIVVSMLRALLRQGTVRQDIALAAPTGKAAQRMGESIRNGLAALADRSEEEQEFIDARVDPETLHRLLVWHPATEHFHHGVGNTLPHKIVIVDESSMISQEHMCRLVGALGKDARLVLLGDPNSCPAWRRDAPSSTWSGPGRPDCVELPKLPHGRVHPEGRNISRWPTLGRTGGGPVGRPRAHPRARRPGPTSTCRQVELLEPAPGVMKAFLALVRP